MSSSFDIASLAIPAVLSLVFFLSYTSQFLFLYLDPAPLTARESGVFNVALLCMLVSYARAILTDPGRIPEQSRDRRDDGQQKEHGDLLGGKEEDVADADANGGIDAAGVVVRRQRWCARCECRKPPRSHHCRKCNRCIPKMDHHCPWTYNCVSHTTYPHFVRFVFYAVTSMIILERFIFIRGAHLWSVRHYPSYHGPTAWQLAHLMLLTVANSMMLIALFLLLARTLWGLLFNITTIEDWEIDRHETLVQRAKKHGGYLDGPDGLRVRIKKQEFPYDIGIWSNVAQAMGTSNPLAWFWPLSKRLPVHTGLNFATNGLEDPIIGWPPPDPERIPRQARSMNAGYENMKMLDETPNTQLASFRERQAQDLKRHKTINGRARTTSTATDYTLVVPATNDVSISQSTPTPSPLSNIRRRRASARGSVRNTHDVNSSRSADAGSYFGAEGAQTWRNSEGERLEDFGLDEDAEFFDEDEVPLAQLLEARHKT